MSAGECRSCGAEIKWAVTSKSRIPLDPEPAPNGNVRVAPSRAVPGELFASVLAGDKLAVARAEGEDLYLSHFATCPHANRHRKR